MTTISNTPKTVQLGDLKPGVWFDRLPSQIFGMAWHCMWIITDVDEDVSTLCVQSSTGKTEWISNSEKVYPRERPY